MEFDKSRVYTALNADELKVGSKVICATCLANLKEYVADYFNEGVDNTCIITSILDETYRDRFQTDINNSPFVYLVSEPEEKKLKWTDLKVGDIVQCGDNVSMITTINSNSSTSIHIYAYDWISDKELESYKKGGVDESQ